MRIAIAAEGKHVSPHFGHCEYFLVVDTNGKEVVGRRMLQTPPHQPGAIPQFLAHEGVKLVITGGMGQNAQTFFEGNGIEVITGCSGTIEDVLQTYLDGELVSSGSVCHEHMHAGSCGRH